MVDPPRNAGRRAVFRGFLKQLSALRRAHPSFWARLCQSVPGRLDTAPTPTRKRSPVPRIVERIATAAMAREPDALLLMAAGR
jgi:hypothetical protein